MIAQCIQVSINLAEDRAAATIRFVVQTAINLVVAKVKLEIIRYY